MGKDAENQQKVWKISDNLLFLLCLKISVMRSVHDYITIIRQNSTKITNDFGIKTLRIFGSVSRNEQTEQSDLDVCVESFFVGRLERIFRRLVQVFSRCGAYS